jgi:hypothetical protein
VLYIYHHIWLHLYFHESLDFKTHQKDQDKGANERN